MLPSINEIRPEQDEMSILSSLFSRPLLHNEIQMTSLKSPGGLSIAALLPYEIAHCSSYEPENLDAEDARLIQEELSYDGHHCNFQSDFSMHEMHPGNFKKADQNECGIPTLWICVKNAFTLAHR